MNGPVHKYQSCYKRRSWWHQISHSYTKCILLLGQNFQVNGDCKIVSVPLKEVLLSDQFRLYIFMYGVPISDYDLKSVLLGLPSERDEIAQSQHKWCIFRLSIKFCRVKKRYTVPWNNAMACSVQGTSHQQSGPYSWIFELQFSV